MGPKARRESVKLSFILVYKDPAKKRLQHIQIALLVLMVPVMLYLGLPAYAEYQAFSLAEAHYLKGHELLHQEKTAEAKVELEKALELYPGLYAAWEELATIHHFDGDHEKELAVYAEALRNMPDDGRLHREVAAAYHEVGRHDEELVSIQRAVELLPEDPLAQKLHERAKQESMASR